MLITFEGLDCSGKSTQARLLIEKLGEIGREVEFIREPGGTDLGERIRDILLDKNHFKMIAETELFLFSSSRAQLVKERIIPALSQGKIVVCDRFYDSSTAYQGGGRGVDIDAINTINMCASNGLVPDLTFFVDLPIGKIETRMSLLKKNKDRMESSGRDFFEKVRQTYLTLATQHPRFRVVDGQKSIQAISEVIWKEVDKAITE